MGLQWRKFLEGQFSDGITNKAIFGSIIDTRDNLLFPSRGFYLLVDLSRAGGILGGNYHFYKYQLSGSFYTDMEAGGDIRIATFCRTNNTLQQF
jgi:outer membrane protein assembly factor BamA